MSHFHLLSAAFQQVPLAPQLQVPGLTLFIVTQYEQKYRTTPRNL